MSPEERARDAMLAKFGQAEYDPQAMALIEEVMVRVVREAIAEDRERCIKIIRRLQFNDQRAVSWHEVEDAIEAIRKGE